MLRAIASMLLVGVLAVPADAQEKFTIKVRKDVKGDVVKVTESDVETGKMKITVNGMEMPKDENKGHSAEFTEKIIEKETGKRPSKIERTYAKAEMTAGGNKITPTFVGKTVLIERTGTSYKFSVGGKELSGDDAKFFSEEFKGKKKDTDSDVEDALLPKEPIAVNGTWKPDVAAIIKEFGDGEDTPLSFDTAKATASGKLVKAYKKDGKQYGVVEITVDLPLKEIGAGAMKIVMEAGSNVKVTFSMDGCIDGSANAGKMTTAMEMKMVGSLEANGVVVKLDGAMKKNGSKTQEPVK